MRILTKKIHRACPELDKFDDAVCKRYIKRAKRLQNAWKFWLMVLVATPLSLGVWLGMMYVTGLIVNQYDYEISDYIKLGIYLFSITGVAWLPAFTILLVRDRWLHRCIRKQLTGVQCPTCGYSLIGLTLLKDTQDPSVHCPECGHTTTLKDMGLTQADIDPTLIQDSV